MRIAAAVLVSALACKPDAVDPLVAATPDAVASVSAPGTGVTEQGTFEGKPLYGTSAMFLGSNLSQAQGPLTLRLQGVAATPGAKIDVYWATMPDNVPSPKSFIGTYTSPEGAPAKVAEVALDVHDFVADGVSYTGRTFVRDLTYYQVTWTVSGGAATVEHFTLTAP